MTTSNENTDTPDAFTALERSVHAALETYANVHRGSGHFSVATTHLFEEARDIVLAHLGLHRRRFMVIFCSPGAAQGLTAQLNADSYRCVSSGDFGLPLGVRALAVERKALRGNIRFQTGGGTARLVSASWVIRAGAPDRFEAGTPAIINIIAFARALQLIRQYGENAFPIVAEETLTAAEILRNDELAEFAGRELLEALRQTLIGRGVRVPTAEGDCPFVNLDNGASTPTFAPIWNAVRRTWRQPIQVQREIVDEVRGICAEVLDAPASDYDVIFTANTTEAINLAAESLGRELAPGDESVVINTLLEHNSNELPWRMIGGVSLVRLSFDADGFVDLNELESLLCDYNERQIHGNRRVKLVAVSGASNVLGVFNDLAEISRMVHRFGARLLVDAAQLIAHRQVAMADCGIDYLAFSAHKAYAPFGTGALVVRKGLLRYSPEELTQICASGEENIGGIAALGKSLLLLQRIGFDVIQAEEQGLTARALRGMAQIPGIRLYGTTDPESPAFAHKGGVIPFDFKRMISHKVGRELAARGGIGVRSGCHCAHLTVKRMLDIPAWAERIQGLIVRVLYRLELPGVVRVSLGVENCEADIDQLVRVLNEIVRQPGTSKNAKQQLDSFVRDTSRKVYAENA